MDNGQDLTQAKRDHLAEYQKNGGSFILAANVDTNDTGVIFPGGVYIPMSKLGYNDNIGYFDARVYRNQESIWD